MHVTDTRAAAEIPFGALGGMLFADDEPLPTPASVRANVTSELDLSWCGSPCQS
jgi:hypothetical protein